MGFANDWRVIVFSSKAARDRYVETTPNISTKAIKASEATQRATNYSLNDNRQIAPRPFTGEYWGIVDFYDEDDHPEGAIGTLEVCHDRDECPIIERFYK